MNSLIVLNKNDNVGVSQFIIPEKTKINGQEISTIDPIPVSYTHLTLPTTPYV